MIYTFYAEKRRNCRSGRGERAFADEKEKIRLRKYRLYAAGICTAIALGTGGCAAAANTTTTAGQVQESTAETGQADATVVETVSGSVESGEENGAEALRPVCIYGPVKRLEDGKFSIDNQSDASSSGEMILNVAKDTTYILDAVSGMPGSAEDIKDGDIIYTYIGPAMTMSLPPMTNAEVIFTNVGEDGKAPEYVEIKSMITNADTSKSVLTTADGTEYTLTEDCNIFPYLTRNIVTMDDLTAGKKCIVWADEEGNANKILLFAR